MLVTVFSHCDFLWFIFAYSSVVHCKTHLKFKSIASFYHVALFLFLIFFNPHPKTSLRTVLW